jgi:uncharacterized membrane protein YeaQ/YmgE (transglycosylase-associated protein family)
MLDFFAWVILGALLGWIASLIMGLDEHKGMLLNVVVGIVGAFLAGLLLSPWLGIGTIGAGGFSLPALLVSLLGAVILLALINLFRPNSAR